MPAPCQAFGYWLLACLLGLGAAPAAESGGGNPVVQAPPVLVTASALDGPSALRLDACDELVRPPAVFRLRLSRPVSVAERLRGPMSIEISLSQGAMLLASDHLTLGHLGELRDGIGVVLAPSALSNQGAEAVALHISLEDAGATTVGTPFTPMESLTRILPTPHTLTAQLDALQARFQGLPDPPPLWQLWLEQGQEITQGAPNLERCHELERLESLLRSQLQLPGSKPELSQQDGALVAYRDAIDGSVQPERRYPPPPPLRGEAWLLGSGDERPVKSAWSEPAQDLLAGAGACGMSLVQAYPAGDERWDGIAYLRAERRLLSSGRGRVLLIGQHRGAIAALRIAAMHPNRVAAVRLLDPIFAEQQPPPLSSAIPVTISGLADPAAGAWATERTHLGGPESAAFWNLPPAASEEAVALPRALVAPDLNTPLTRYAQGPFVVVVGMGEHRAAQEDDRELARRFIGAWAEHAQGLPRCVDDAEFDAKAYRHASWILIGNPRSNRVIARLAKRHPLPIAWDSRSLSLGAETYPRAEHRAVALLVTRDDGGTAVLLDGAPAWGDRGLPLTGLTSPSIGEATTPAGTPSAGRDTPMMARP